MDCTELTGNVTGKYQHAEVKTWEKNTYKENISTTDFKEQVIFLRFFIFRFERKDLEEPKKKKNVI